MGEKFEEVNDVKKMMIQTAESHFNKLARVVFTQLKDENDPTSAHCTKSLHAPRPLFQGYIGPTCNREIGGEEMQNKP